MSSRLLKPIIDGKPLDYGGKGPANVTGILPFFGDAEDGKGIIMTPKSSYSRFALDSLEGSIAQGRLAQASINDFTLDEAIEEIQTSQVKLEQILRAGNGHSMIRAYCRLRGYSDPKELFGSVRQLRTDFVDRLAEGQRDMMIGGMLGKSGDAQELIGEASVPDRYLVWMSGQLGIYEEALMLYYSILSRAASNGHSRDVVFKTSGSDNLVHDLLEYCITSERAKEGISWITWNSSCRWDDKYLPRLLGMFDNGNNPGILTGGMHFGSKKTLDMLAKKYSDKDGQIFFYDHFPIMVIGEGATNEDIKRLAGLALSQAYSNRGEACLSLQNVYVVGSDDLYDRVEFIFAKYYSRLADRLKPNYYPEGTIEDIEAFENMIRNGYGAVTRGTIKRETNEIGPLMYSGVPINADPRLLAQENPAPLLMLVHSDEDISFMDADMEQLRESSSDRHIYVISAGVSDLLSSHLSLRYISHRHYDASMRGVTGFKAFDPSIFHCGQNMLSLMFGRQNPEPACYLG